LDELVDKVMIDLRNSGLDLGKSSVSAALTRDFRSIQSKKLKEDKFQTLPVSSFPAKDLTDEHNSLDEVFTLTDRVIFAEIVTRYASQTACKRWKVGLNAVVTPSAKDELKKRNIELFSERVVVDSDSVNKGCLAGMETSFPKTRVTFSASNMAEGSLVFSRMKTKENSKRARVFLANHLPEAENLPLNVREFLNRNSLLTEVRFTCLKEASRRVQSESKQDDTLKTLLATHDGAIGSIWCNRLSGVRALAAFSYDQVCLDLEATNANVVIVDPSRVGSYQFRRIVDYYLRSEMKKA